MIVSLRRKLIFWFLTFTALSFVLVIPFNIIYFKKREKVAAVVNEVQLLHLSLLKNRNLENDIYNIDSKDPQFFCLSTSENLIKLKKEKLKLYSKMEQLEKNEFLGSIYIDKDIKAIHKLVRLSNLYSDTILSCILARGFKNEGVIGEMRKNIHAIEKTKNVDLVTVLMLRRHEKDFMLRNDKEYIKKVNNLSSVFKQQIIKSSIYNKHTKAQLLVWIDGYLKNFNKIVELDNLSGLKNNTGLKQKQDICYMQIDHLQQSIFQKAENEKKLIFENLEHIYIFYFIILMTTALMLCLFISKNIAKPLRQLTSYISKMKKDNMKFEKIPEIGPTFSEARVLTYEFCQMFFLLEQREEERNKYIEQLIDAREKAEVSDKLKTAFLSNMSHEIRTPMNAIIGFSSLLNNESKCEETKRDYIKHIQTSGKHLLKIIDDIIDIAKIEAGEIKITEASCNIHFLLDDLYQYFMLLNKKNIELIVSKDIEDEKLSIKVDSYRLRQILINLINNALKFTQQGFVEFGYIRTGKFIQFYVKDTGIGIPENMQKTIFERFRQVTHKNKHFGGTGLGLTITQNLVKLMGGQIWVISELDRGSTFFFSLPFKKSENNLISKNEFVEA